ncbi:MAG TPA: hypothetical protein VGI10_24475 [Polyangiaceae bacterium]|jgi:hypothetical protein
MRRAILLRLLLTTTGAGVLGACGGVDRGGRPSEERLIDTTPFDDCAQTAGLEFLSIESFEPGQKKTDLCDNSPNCVNLNYDQGNANRCDIEWVPNPTDPNNPERETCPPGHAVNDSPRACTKLMENVCLQADGTPYPDDGVTGAPSATRTCVTASSSVPQTESLERCGQTSTASHVQGRNLAICYSPRSHKPGWGGNLRITFAYDASDWDGVSFWAKTGDGPTGTGLLPHILDPYTNGTAMPLCSTAAIETEPDQAKCDPFGLSAVITDNWRFYQMPFDEVRQKGFGQASPLPYVDRSQIRAVEFTFNAGDWDFWIDDVAFYRDKR